MIEEKYIAAAREVDIVDVFQDITGTAARKTGSAFSARCPFHDDRSPSCVLYPQSGTWHCFGCGKGGDVISLVMKHTGKDFLEAVKYILSRYRYDIDTSAIFCKTTAEDDRIYREKESVYACNEAAWKFWRACYNDEQTGLHARLYAERNTETGTGRWPKEYCEQIGLGWAVEKSSDCLAHLLSLGFSLEVIKKARLVGLNHGAVEDSKNPDDYHDFFRGRLMIPQRDRAGHIVTFTARVLEAREGVAKYMNTADTIIYKKSRTVFGIDVAYRHAKAKGKVYLVEGAPDVMRLQSMGISNAVATLGGKWSEEQLGQFRSFMPVLCFIPDMDVPKGDCRWGTGEQFVMDNGRRAVEMGFRVNVRLIPTDHKRKVDIDEFLTGEDRWSELTEQDFVLWYAEMVYDKSGDTDSRNDAMSAVADLLAMVGDETRQMGLLEELKSRYGLAKLWRVHFRKAMERRMEAVKSSLSRSRTDERDSLSGYSFYQRGKHYYSYTKDGQEVDWTNFILRPLYLIENGDRPSRIFCMENESGENVTVELRQADVTSLMSFREKIEGKGNFRFRAKAEQYEDLKAYMYDRTESAVRVTQMGWNVLGEERFYAFANGIVRDGEWLPVDDYGIVRMDTRNVFIPALSKMYSDNRRAFVNERRFVHATVSSVSRERYFDYFVRLYGDNGIVALAYYVSALFRDIIVAKTNSFPILFVYGKKGTGKTELCRAIMAMLQQDDEVSTLASTTLFAMGEKLAQVANGLVYFDEYKNSITEERVNILKATYNSSGRVKRSNDGESREQTFVDSGLILSGQEMPTADIALFERTLFLESMNAVHTKEESLLFSEMMELRSLHPTNITVEILRYRREFENGWRTAWKKAQSEVKDRTDGTEITERIINNWAMLYATVLCAEGCGLSLGFSAKKVLEVILRKVMNQSQKSEQVDELALFWQAFDRARMSGELIEGQDYKIKHVTGKLDVTRDRQRASLVLPEEGKDVLYVRANYCLGKVCVLARKEGLQMIPPESLLSYIMSTSEYMGKKCTAERFRVHDRNGDVVETPKYESGMLVRKEVKADFERPLVFDYSSLSDKYDVDLHRETMDASKVED